MEEDILNQMVESLVELGFDRTEAIEEINYLYLENLIINPDLN